MQNCNEDVESLMNVGALLINAGFLKRAQNCFERIRKISPNDLRAVVNLATIAHEEGNHVESYRLYKELLLYLPENSVIRRNILVSMEYNPFVADQERMREAIAWGKWVEKRANTLRKRPPLFPLKGRKLRIGYVSADLCQHTVGLFVKDVFAAHNSERVSVFAYHAGPINDWVTKYIRATCQFRDVIRLSDTQLAALIREDRIDILIDLSGHTAGSRLTVFAHRPAPIQISWLGYFATTGLSSIDAVLLDKWHAPEYAESMYVERIVRLPLGRFCYQPVPWAPTEIMPAPCFMNGYVTFGCFNNTAKLNHAVFDVWVKILTNVSDSRLILKWRTFNDETMCKYVQNYFEEKGISSDRIELRTASFHKDLLHQYADIDIALDPFPFTGGLTSCEALWMGVPIVTWPQSRVVSRQTFALLMTIGLSKLVAKSAEDYVRIAEDLAMNKVYLGELRKNLRDKMRSSPLMRVTEFTYDLEQSMFTLFHKISDRN